MIDGYEVADLLDGVENSPNWEIMWAQEDVLWEFFPEMVDPLLERLDAEDDRTKKRAVRALGWIGDERATEPLIAILRGGESKEIRAEAATALGGIGSQVALDPLLDAFEDAPSTEFRWAVIRALGGIGADDELRDILFGYDGDDAEEIRPSSIAALGCSEVAYAAREKIIDHGTPAERATVASHLGSCRTDRDFELLLELLDDPEPETRGYAAQSLGSYFYDTQREFKVNSFGEAFRRWVGLSSPDERLTQAIQKLVELTSDEHSDVRRQSMLAMRSLGSNDLLGRDKKRVRQVLLDSKENDESKEVREMAARVLSYF